MPESEKWSQNNIGYIQISSERCRIRQDFIKIMSDTSLKSLKEATCSNNTHFCGVFSPHKKRQLARSRLKGGDQSWKSWPAARIDARIATWIGVGKVRFWCKMLCVYIWNCASYAGGEHFFRKIIKKKRQKIENGFKIMWYASRYRHKHVAYIKISSNL